MYILGIESSCDETAVAVVERGKGSEDRVIGEEIKSQVPLHAKYGGVVPEIASRNHYRVIDDLTRRVLQEAGLQVEDIHLIAVTQGPGLIGSLLVGLAFAKGLSYANRIPLVPVDHIDAHIESPFIENPDIQFPLLALVVSGGHTSLFFRESRFEGELLARTRDDAVGEVMDKIAKFFDLGYPGGPILDKLYPEGEKKRFSFTIPRMSDGSNDFSFSGYKTAALRVSREFNVQTDTQAFKDLVSSFLHSVVDYLLKKTVSAAQEKGVRSIVVAGGVSRNTLLRKVFREECDRREIKLYLPSPRYCTDNASMVAWLGYEKHTAFPGLDYHDLRLNAYSRAPFKGGPKHR